MSTADPVRGNRAVSEAGRLAAMLLSPTFIVLGISGVRLARGGSAG